MVVVVVVVVVGLWLWLRSRRWGVVWISSVCRRARCVRSACARERKDEEGPLRRFKERIKEMKKLALPDWRRFEGRAARNGVASGFREGCVRTYAGWELWSESLWRRQELLRG